RVPRKYAAIIPHLESRCGGVRLVRSRSGFLFSGLNLFEVEVALEDRGFCAMHSRDHEPNVVDRELLLGQQAEIVAQIFGGCMREVRRSVEGGKLVFKPQ